jgi:tRNA(fMet)-specific endonuclease VapC
MKYILDTNICIYLIKQKPESLLKKVLSLTPGELAISSVTVAELYYGVHKSQHVERNLQALNNFLLPLEILPFDDAAASFYGQIRAYLEKQGTPIGSLDLMIASHTVSLGITLVTNNIKEFIRVPNLSVENWV